MQDGPLRAECAVHVAPRREALGSALPRPPEFPKFFSAQLVASLRNLQSLARSPYCSRERSELGKSKRGTYSGSLDLPL